MVYTIKSVEFPKDSESAFRGGLYTVYVNEHNIPISCYKVQYERIVYEEEMLKSGVPAKMIEKHRELVGNEHIEESDFAF